MNDGASSRNHCSLVLVVDDDAGIGRLITLALSYAGIRAVSATDCKTALAMARLEEPDLVILDLHIPVMDGRSFYQAFRNEGMGAPVVILSAHGARAAQRKLGAEDSMDKPFNIGDLQERVDKLLATRG
jgi:two-component system response regulator AdeR